MLAMVCLVVALVVIEKVMDPGSFQFMTQFPHQIEWHPVLIISHQYQMRAFFFVATVTFGSK